MNHCAVLLPNIPLEWTGRRKFLTCDSEFLPATQGQRSEDEDPDYAIARKSYPDAANDKAIFSKIAILASILICC